MALKNFSAHTMGLLRLEAYMQESKACNLRWKGHKLLAAISNKQGVK